MSTNITEAPNENQELVTETVTNEDGTKSIRNTLRDKATAQDNTANTKIGSNSSKGSSTNKKDLQVQQEAVLIHLLILG